MRKFLLSIYVLVNVIMYAQLAPQITTTDCKDIEHDLYSELNQGKVVVIGWAMPCLSCASPLLEINNAVIDFAISNPNMVKFWLADDFANTSCSSLESWSNNTGLTMAIEFSTTDIKMSDFGSNGMPKVVVIGCNGKIYYNVNNNPSGSGVTDAVNTAFNEINAGCLNNINEIKISKILAYPNPINDDKLMLNLSENVKLNEVQIVNLEGKVLNVFEINNSSDNIELDLSNLQNGVYELLFVYNGKVIERQKCVKK